MPKREAKKKPVNYDALTAEDRQKALENALAQIEKDFGKEAIMKLGDSKRNRNIPVTSTGCLGIDLALGIGGVPAGRIVEIFGPESSGKTTLALHIVAEAQKKGGIVSYVDAEHALDPLYAKKLGVDIDELYISQPDDGEQALEIVENMVRSGAVDIVVIDSVAALVPRAEIDGDMGDAQVGLQARLMSQALRKLAGVVNRSGSTVIFINQLREKIGGITYGGGPNVTTSGGRALKFYASIRIDIQRIGGIKDSDEKPLGNRTRVKIAKNKLAPPFKKHEFDIMFGEGISREGDIIDMAIEEKIMKQSGAWFSYGDLKVQGREKFKNHLKENPRTLIEMENAIRRIHEFPEIEIPGENANTESPESEKDTKETKDTKTAKKSKKIEKPEEQELVIVFEE